MNSLVSVELSHTSTRNGGNAVSILNLLIQGMEKIRPFILQFIKLVHPDRYLSFPVAQRENTKSLQVFLFLMFFTQNLLQEFNSFLNVVKSRISHHRQEKMTCPVQFELSFLAHSTTNRSGALTKICETIQIPPKLLSGGTGDDWNRFACQHLISLLSKADIKVPVELHPSKGPIDEKSEVFQKID